MRRRMLAAGAMMLLTYALATACGGGVPAGTLATDGPTGAATGTTAPDATTQVDQPEPTTPATSTSPTSPTDEPAGPEPPAEALAPTRAGAKEFARFYVDQLSTGYSYGDVTGMRAHSTEACGLCRDYAAEYETIARNGGWVRGDPTWRVDTVSIERFGAERSTLDVALTIGEHTYADSAIDPEQHSPQRSYAFSFDLRHDGRQWLVIAASAENA